MALAGSAADRHRRPGGRPWPPREWGRALRCAASEGGGHGHREVGKRRRPGARLASSPPADEDGDEATGYHSENRGHQEDQENKRILHTHLIGEWSSK